MKKARLQVDPDLIDSAEKPPQSGTVFNIWFLRWSGGDSSLKTPTKLKFRVKIRQDSGQTRATATSSICLFFARGCCYRGSKCPYKHRLPDETTDYFVPTQDCFGRDRSSLLEDLDGVASLTRKNRTLYVAGLLQVSPLATQAMVSRHFLEFGALEAVKVLAGKRCAFVTYKTEAQAQFAKEAMNSQSLDGEEILSVRWASEDPNPQAKREEERRLQAEAERTVKRLLLEVDDSRKRRKVEEKEVKEAEDDETYENSVAEESEVPPQAEWSRPPLIHPETLRQLSKLRNYFIKPQKRLVDYDSGED